MGCCEHSNEPSGSIKDGGTERHAQVFGMWKDK
jgi:hypothetical protein